MNFKRVSTIFLSAAMCASLCACGAAEPPTAEELISGSKLAEASSIDADLNVRFGADIAMGELISDGAAPMSISADLNLSGSKDVQKMEGVMNINLFGSEYSENVLSYTATDSDSTVTTYSQDSDSGIWLYTTQPAEDSSKTLNSITAMGPEMFSDLTLEPVEKGDKVYTVTGFIDMADFMQQSSLTPDDMLGLDGFSVDTISEGKVSAVLTFDRESEQMTDMSLEFDPTSFVTDEMQVTELSLSMHINSIDNVTVTVPDDVISSATDADAYSTGITESSAES